MQRQREGSVGSQTSRALRIDEEKNFSSSEEKQLVALQPKLNNKVLNRRTAEAGLMGYEINSEFLTLSCAVRRRVHALRGTISDFVIGDSTISVSVFVYHSFFVQCVERINR